MRLAADSTNGRILNRKSQSEAHDSQRRLIGVRRRVSYVLNRRCEVNTFGKLQSIEHLRSPGSCRATGYFLRLKIAMIAPRNRLLTIVPMAPLRAWPATVCASIFATWASSLCSGMLMFSITSIDAVFDSAR